MSIYVKTPARLHLGLIDLNGELGRLYGGLGVAIDHPNVVLEAKLSKNFTVNGEKKELTTNLARRFFEAYKTNENVEINVKQVIPEHAGFGSGTQLALAVATALSKLFNLKTTPQELAVVMKRTNQSGVGTALFAQGGFVVDGGRNTKDPPHEIIPVICRCAFPEEWRFVIALPETNKGLANENEKSAFKKLPPMPAEAVGKLCRLIMMKLIPAISEKNIEDFGNSLTQIQNIVGDSFSEAQGGRFSSTTATKCIEFMRENGAFGSGQSSWGPAIYGIVKRFEAKEIRSMTQEFLNKQTGGRVFIAKARNRGAIVKCLK